VLIGDVTVRLAGRLGHGVSDLVDMGLAQLDNNAMAVFGFDPVP
jgi:hypothetical protein